MTKIKTKVSTHWQIFKGRLLIDFAVGTAAVGYKLYLKWTLAIGNRTNIKDKGHEGSNLAINIKRVNVYMGNPFP